MIRDIVFTAKYMIKDINNFYSKIYIVRDTVFIVDI
jgi:hypothetical protein